jgi:AraC family transcriptional regulator
MREAIAARKAADHWGMSPIGYLDRLPETGVSIARWRRENDSEAYRQKPSRWSRYLLSLVLEPMQAQAWVEGKQIWSGKISANSVRIVHPDDERHWSSVGGFDLLHVMIPRETIAAMIGAEPGTVRFTDPLYSRDEMLQQIGHQLLWVMGQQGSFVRQIADGLAHTIVAYMLRRYALGRPCTVDPGLRPMQIRRVTDLIASRLSDDISLEEMAAAAGMSRFHFSRQFRLAMGASPHRYAMTKRIERAKELLRNRSSNVLDVALSCGFKDASHFSRTSVEIAVPCTLCDTLTIDRADIISE